MQNAVVEKKRLNSRRLFDDVLLITIMAVLAGCGLIYEYLLSHYAGRVIGAVESAIYTMIGIMIVSMGVGSFAARHIKCAFNGFAWLELTIAFIGSTAILVISGAIAAVQLLPSIISQTYNIPPDSMSHGGIFKTLHWLTHYSPYGVGALLGLFIGMEIPLIARIREQLHQAHLLHNTGTIYGADYIGAGIGAAIWIGFMLSIDINLSASLTASVNLIAGLAFWLRYKSYLNKKYLLLFGHVVVSVVVAMIFQYGSSWSTTFNNTLYLDKVVHQQQTRFAQVVLTERQLPQQDIPSLSLYLNGRLQFSANDEKIYHKFLVYPAMASSLARDNVLIIGGGDGLALREVLHWSPKQVTLIDLDKQLVDLFRHPQDFLPHGVAKNIAALNQGALSDPRVSIVHDDAYNALDSFIANNTRYDTVIIDLPDPSHPDLNKLYSKTFYQKVKQLLSKDGVVAVQSTSPFHAKNAFVSIHNTLSAAGWKNVQQYHYNVPSFGQWGWTIASQQGQMPRQRLANHSIMPFEHWLTQGLIQASFEFPQDFYQHAAQIKVNELGSFVLYRYHQQAWESQQGTSQSWYQQ